MAEQDHPACTRFCQWLLPTSDVPEGEKFMLVSEAGIKIINKYINQLHRESALLEVQYGCKVDPENNFQFAYLLKQLFSTPV